MYSQEATILSNIEIIEFDIFLALQLETRNSIIVDTVNNQPLLYNNKFITYPKSDMNDKDIIGFDPFNNNRLMQFLFSLYMKLSKRCRTGSIILYIKSRSKWKRNCHL